MQTVSGERDLRLSPWRKFFLRTWVTSAPGEGSLELISLRVFTLPTVKLAALARAILMRMEFPGIGHPCVDSRWRTL